jgi:hypothetical protein
MKMRGASVLICIALLATLWLPAAAGAEEAGITVARFVTAGGVANREPVDVSSTFPASVGRVYCFLEAQDIAKDTEVSMVWYYQGHEAALVTLLLRESGRWRTWSSKKIAGRTGQWKVVLRDEDGNDLKTAEFTVE